MIKFSLIITFCLIAGIVSGQDRMILLNDKIVEVKVIEVNLSDIIYLQQMEDRIDTFSVRQKLVKQIVYKNGLMDDFVVRRDKFFSYVPKDYKNTDSIMSYLGMLDAERHFRKYRKKVIFMTFLNQFATPLAGLIYYKKVKHLPITEVDLLSDEKTLFANEAYKKAYFQQAKKMFAQKLKRVYLFSSMTFFLTVAEILSLHVTN